MWIRSIALSGVIFASLVMGGTPIKKKETGFPEPRPLGRNYKPVTILQEANNALEPTTTATYQPVPKTLTLRDVLTLVLKQNQILNVFSLEVRARDAEKLQASYLPNPELELETEGIGGSNSYSGNKSSETTLQLSQLVELGKKRSFRKRLAGLEYNLAGWDYETIRLNVLTEATKSFLSVLALEQKVELHQELFELSKNVYKVVSERVEAGKVSPLEKTKAGVVLSTTRIQGKQAQRALVAARTHLASFWGSPKADFETVKGDLEEDIEIPTEVDIQSFIHQNPDLARWMTEVEYAKQRVSLEKANRIPDLSIKAGYRKYNETNDRAFTIGFAIPLKLFNRNKGNIMAANYRLKQAQRQQKAASVDIMTRFSENYQLLISANESVEALKSEVLPAAQWAFDASNEGYREGKFRYLDVLDAQRTLFGIKLEYIEALLSNRHYKADIERLIGMNLDDLHSNSNIENKGVKK